ncbi:phosphatidylglycerophosphatase A [Helicobacter anatolicus]|uniref:phosphatidylglycerophosphatase A family protein n=1 Tax=Helicobacter anatolicus TaxID=2905874 RepID=UPI001E50D731|nr:phosphatidylglycerophosphatase A [Helicobacter anatolicus]MCE3040001.1 phosphatidylglycerophosphatase A [Helicobacter anatolicus]
MRECFLTLFFSGKSPRASGTIGSLVALIPAIFLVQFSSQTLFLLAILIGGIAVKQIDIYEKEKQVHDPKEIVIDELVGMWLALSIAVGAIGFSWWVVVLSFVFFRIYDITKPSVIGKIDKKLKGGLGVVLDDALAGVIGGFSTIIALKLIEFIQNF